MRTQTRPRGTQCIERAIHLMKLLATRDRFGWGLTDLARRAGLDKATVHRILSCLENDRLVQRDVRAHRYFPGPMLVELGLSVTSYQPLMDEARATITRLAQRTGGVGFFYLLSGCDFVCAGRVENSPNPGMLNEVGCRRPLIMSAGGVAMLLAMPAAERDVLVARNLRDVADMHIPQLDRFERMLARALQLGYAANLEDVVPGIHSFSMPILDRLGRPLGSIAIAGEATRFPAAGGRRFADLLSFEASELAAKAPGLSSGRAQAAIVEAVTALH